MLTFVVAFLRSKDYLCVLDDAFGDWMGEMFECVIVSFGVLIALVHFSVVIYYFTAGLVSVGTL